MQLEVAAIRTPMRQWHLAISLSVSMLRWSLTMKMRSKRERMVDCRSILSWAD